MTPAFTTTHGDMPKWQAAVDALPEGRASQIDLNADAVTVGTAADLDETAARELAWNFQALIPWRKGPFSLFGMDIDTEWRSDWKWQRVLPHLGDLTDRSLLDIGCGSGYHCWRACGAGAGRVVGIDPMPLFAMQFEAVRKLMLPHTFPVEFLSVGIDDLSDEVTGFDTVLSMGVLYHRRSPLDHLQKLKALANPGGQVVVETLVVPGGPDTVLVPRDRYGRMRNVWMIPSCEALVLWMARCGFQDVRVVDVTPTTTGEQRSTDWMPFESLAEALDPSDADRTIEGYPAPVRAVVFGVA